MQMEEPPDHDILDDIIYNTFILKATASKKKKYGLGNIPSYRLLVGDLGGVGM